MYLDLAACGIGNIVLCASGYKYVCDAMGYPPLVYTPTPEDLSGLRDDVFVVVTERPEGLVEFDKSLVCAMLTACNPQVLNIMRHIVKPMDPSAVCATLGLPPGTLDRVSAGMSIRFGDRRHDKDELFMTATAVDALYAEMSRHGAVLVCTNDPEMLPALPPNAILAERTDSARRNAASHWAQWHALASCPVVYHGIAGSDGSLTTTFAPTAAFYGGREVVGVRNDGDILHWGAGYAWAPPGGQ